VAASIANDNDRDLGALIDLQIRTQGPMSIASYMGLCLTHPTKGYYRKADPLGTAGDFITAPEISQMFGEMIGFFVVTLWQQMGSPKAFTLLELGPGRGTLMADILRVACRAEGFRDGLELRLFETNPVLTGLQNQRLEPYEPKWIEDFDEIGDGPLLVVANEFFDALPIRQFVNQDGGWYERVVGLVDGKRAFGLAPSPLPAASLPEALASAQAGEISELAIAGSEVMNRLSRNVARVGGAILAIDYGYARTQTGETLQAVKRHGYVDPLDDPGEADLSAHVDFEALGAAAVRNGLAVQPLATQRQFLAQMGIAERTRSLAAANPEAATQVMAAFERLTGETHMGELFKVFCAASPGLMPPGFTK
jgi:SAM-dependent MidA family methyltransferase